MLLFRHNVLPKSALKWTLASFPESFQDMRNQGDVASHKGWWQHVCHFYGVSNIEWPPSCSLGHLKRWRSTPFTSIVAPYIISLSCVSLPGLQSTVWMHLTMQCRNILVLGTFLPSTKPVTFGVKAEWNTMFPASNYFLCIKHRIFIYYHQWLHKTVNRTVQTAADKFWPFVLQEKRKKLSCVIN